MKIYDKEMYVKQEKLKTITMFLIIFLIGFVAGYFATSFSKSNTTIENKTANEIVQEK